MISLKKTTKLQNEQENTEQMQSQHENTELPKDNEFFLLICKQEIIMLLLPKMSYYKDIQQFLSLSNHVF